MKVTVIMTVAENSDNLIIRDVPVSSTVIEYNKHSLGIIDTGMADNDQLAWALDELGYHPSSFDLVINTHLHCDHVGGNRLFQNARIAISRKEYEYEKRFNQVMQDSQNPLTTLTAMGRSIDKRHEGLAADLKRLSEAFSIDTLLGEKDRIEYFEDEPKLPQGITLISAAGHSIDSRAVCLKGISRMAVAAGDALYHRDLWRESSLPGINYDEAKCIENARRLSRFRGVIIPGHDRAFNNRYGSYLTDDSFVL